MSTLPIPPTAQRLHLQLPSLPLAPNTNHSEAPEMDNYLAQDPVREMADCHDNWLPSGSRLGDRSRTSVPRRAVSHLMDWQHLLVLMRLTKWTHTPIPHVRVPTSVYCHTPGKLATYFPMTRVTPLRKASPLALALPSLPHQMESNSYWSAMKCCTLARR